ncbi:MAG: DUF1697 domain-containing protein [Mycobacteriaceae bacterium]
MTSYVAFLRGINVGSINIKMAELSQVFSDLGFSEVKTILATGNVLFDSAQSDVAVLKAGIETQLRNTFGYQAWVIVHERSSVSPIVENYPFEAESTEYQPYVILTADAEIKNELLKLGTELDTQIEIIADGELDVIYWQVRRGMTTQSVFGKHLAKTRYKAFSTTRNLRTMEKLR